jgi:hypothetical protein
MSSKTVALVATRITFQAAVPSRRSTSTVALNVPESVTVKAWSRVTAMTGEGPAAESEPEIVVMPTPQKARC